ncbi:MAG: hypothetical protein HKN91_02130 [Acidimicrobiia bacterium]|nr:hypothetical protein [Acidimicrobiia bacterium]
MRNRFVAVLLIWGIVFVACGGDPDTFTEVGGGESFPEGSFAVPSSGDLSVGEERLLVGVSLADNTRLGSPGDDVTFTISPEGAPDEARVVPATYVWILEPVVGLYRANVEFDRPGIWQVVVTPAGADPLEPALFNVFEESFAPKPGEPAPLPDTPTLDDMPIEELTTDGDPDPSFYQTSLPDAVASGDPTVLVFSTPAYCQTSACGPLLDIVKDAAPGYPDVNFIHVEVFTGLTDPDFAPDGAHLAPAVGPDWYNLPSEPWVFVIDEDGLVSDRFEGVMDSGELADALGKISL